MRRHVLLILAPTMVYWAAVDVQSQVAEQGAPQIGAAPQAAADPAQAGPECGNGLCGPLEDCGICPVDCSCCVSCPASNCSNGILTQSTTMAIVPGVGVACADLEGNTTPNAWARCFNPIEEGWVDEGGAVTMTIESIDFGFETAPPTDTGPIPIFVNVYLDLNGCPPDMPSALLIGTAQTAVSPGDAGVLLNAVFDPPLFVEVPEWMGLIVEFENLLDGTDPDNGIGLFGLLPGGNFADQCAPTYIRAAACGFPDWENRGDLGVEDFHLALRVHVSNDCCGACGGGPACGDCICSGGENCVTCEYDCQCPPGTECTDNGCETFCGNGTCDLNESCESCEADCGGCEDCGYECDSGVLTQSTDASDTENQVACGTADGTTENAWARCFDLSENGLDSDVEINNVTFGIQDANIEGIPVNVNLYIDGDGCPASGFGTANAPLLASESIVVGPGDQGSLITIDFSGLMPPVVPAGASLIVEVETTANGNEEPFHFFRSRSNDLGQCRANYLRAAQCGNVDWTDMSAIAGGAFADVALVMSVSMSCVAGCGDCPTDVNDDGNTGPIDLATLLGEWGPTFPGDCLDADGDSVIGPLDLAALLAAWGPCL